MVNESKNGQVKKGASRNSRTRDRRNFAIFAGVTGTILMISLVSEEARAYSSELFLALISFTVSVGVYVITSIRTEFRSSRKKLRDEFSAMQIEVKGTLDNAIMQNKAANLKMQLDSSKPFSLLAEMELELYTDRLEAMRKGRFTKLVVLSHEQLSHVFLPLFSDLKEGDTWDTVSIAPFWSKKNIGGSVSYINANRRAIGCGANVRRAFVLPPGDDLAPWEVTIIQELRKLEGTRFFLASSEDTYLQCSNFGIWNGEAVMELEYAEKKNTVREKWQFCEITVTGRIGVDLKTEEFQTLYEAKDPNYRPIEEKELDSIILDTQTPKFGDPIRNGEISGKPPIVR